MCIESPPWDHYRSAHLSLWRICTTMKLLSSLPPIASVICLNELKQPKADCQVKKRVSAETKVMNTNTKKYFNKIYKTLIYLVSLVSSPFQLHVSIMRSKSSNIWNSSTVCAQFPEAWLQAVVCCCCQGKAGITTMINRPSSDPGQQNEQFLVRLFAWVVVPSCTFQRASEKPHLKWIEKTKPTDGKRSAVC